MSKIYGIDVSLHQGAINWATVAAELRRVNGGTSPGFAILRAGYSARHGKGGLYMDGQLLRNIKGCEQYGVPMGILLLLLRSERRRGGNHGRAGRQGHFRAQVRLSHLLRCGI